MNGLLLFSVLVCLLPWANCAVASYNLTNLCREDVFNVRKTQHGARNTTVNSFLRLSFEKELPKIKDFYLSKTDLPDLNINYSERFKNFHLAYDELLVEVYAEDYVNDLKNKPIHIKRQRLDELEQEMDDIFTNGIYTSNKKEWREYYDGKMRKTRALIDNLTDAKKNVLNDFFMPFPEFEKLLSALTFTNYQEPSFSGLFPFIIYSKKIFAVSDMRLDRKSGLFTSPQSNGVLYCNIYLPVNNLRYSEEMAQSGECSRTKDLPSFYRNNAKPSKPESFPNNNN